MSSGNSVIWAALQRERREAWLQQWLQLLIEQKLSLRRPTATPDQAARRDD